MIVDSYLKLKGALQDINKIIKHDPTPKMKEVRKHLKEVLIQAETMYVEAALMEDQHFEEYFNMEVPGQLDLFD